MFRVSRNLAALALLLIIGVPLARTNPTPPALSADPELLRKGEYLAHAADCVACHSAHGGAAYAGGLGMGTPLGTIYTTNITPETETGIGLYSLADFDRALRRGIARDGHHLYPSMPYPSYAKISDADIAALYGYFMTAVKPVRQANRATAIPWPLNMRWPLALWNALFLDQQPYQAAAGHDAQWNRGAYLAQGLGHCGACHTPRGWLFEEKALSEAKPVYLSGAPLDNWSAADLTGDAVSGLGRWSEADLVQFFKTGHATGAAAFGSMIDVINYSTQYLNDDDNTALAHYLKSLAPARLQGQQGWTYDPAAEQALDASTFTAPGSLAYLQYCGGCHQRNGQGGTPDIPALAGNPAVLDPDPISVINIALNGSSPVVVGGSPDAYRMISFRTTLNDQQLADVVSFIRSAWGNHAAAVSPNQVTKLRAKTDPVRYEELDLLRMR
jgi:alcohol dehydrogenase (quinone), cytochrome c subunit